MELAALGGEMYDFAGSDTVDTVAWHWQNNVTNLMKLHRKTKQIQSL